MGPIPIVVSPQNVRVHQIESFNMKIGILGAGPAGLYAAILCVRRWTWAPVGRAWTCGRFWCWGAQAGAELRLRPAGESGQPTHGCTQDAGAWHLARRYPL